jgi:hypothetical protein
MVVQFSEKPGRHPIGRHTLHINSSQNSGDSVKYYIGWDVGAWYCTNGSKPCDALCVLVDEGNGPKFTGTVWRKNLKSCLNERRGKELVRDMLSCCDVDVPQDFEAVIAIDTPLGWPTAMVNLATGEDIASVDGFRQNPYLFRETERFLSERGFKPLSAVQDMIGSQSTKGIHFLRAAGPRAEDVGVWKADHGETAITIIETYPTPCKSSETFQALFSSIDESDEFRGQVDGRGEASLNDVRDALRCALIAWLYSEKPQSLKEPGPGIVPEEGWIWVPEDALS